jgi:hypothetical protein
LVGSKADDLFNKVGLPFLSELVTEEVLHARHEGLVEGGEASDLHLNFI